jgi:hypothetical protein
VLKDDEFLDKNKFYDDDNDDAATVSVFDPADLIYDNEDTETVYDPQEQSDNDQDVNSIDADLENLEHAPINKSASTKTIEAILEKLDEKSKIRFKNGEYILSLPPEEFNLSLLINNANLSHLTLNKKVIKKLATLLEKMSLLPFVNYAKNPIFYQLHPIQQYALKAYASDGYRSINQFFRQEKTTDSLMTDGNVKKKNYLAAFILGCLINDALTKIPSLADNFEEKKKLNKLAYCYDIEIEQLDTEDKYFAFLEMALKDEKISSTEAQALKGKFDILHYLFPKTTVLDRGETIDEEVITRRINNPSRFPALTSFSKIKYGIRFAHVPGSTRTTLRNPPTHYQIGDEDEQEVILPHGGQVVSKRQADDSLVATFVRSPTLEPQDHYHSELALRYAYTHYLSKEYKEETSATRVNGETIYRPNHGLAHTYRVMLGVEIVIQYFSEYAADPAFKTFCENLSFEDIERLRIAAAFSISGRESEIAAIEDLKRYDRYRAKSSEHFINYADKSSLFNDFNKKEQLYSVVRYMGNPYYEDTYKELNQHPSKKQRTLREFYNRILTVAHKLDLVRCYSPDQFERSMKNCVDLSAPSEAQNQAYQEMTRYFTELNKAHGDNICNYQPVFADVSLSLKRTKEVAETVRKPRLVQTCHVKNAL